MNDTRAGAPLTERELAAWRGLLRVHRDVVARLDAELEREHSLPLTSFEVLVWLVEEPNGRMRLGDLANVLLLSRSGLTRLIDRLERQRLVKRERCEDDARGYYAVITDAGRRKLDKARPDHRAGLREHFFGRLVDGDLDALAAAWERVERT